MHRRAISLVLAVVLAAALSPVAGGSAAGDPAPAPAPASARPWPTLLQDDAVFLHRSDGELERSVRLLRHLGVDWLRITAGWSVIAPAPEARRRPGFDAADHRAYPRGAWARLDRAVRSAHRQGLRLMIDIAFWAPRWASRPSGAGARPSPGRHRHDPVAAEFARFAHAVADRYSGRHRGLPAAVGFTVWNEPNHPVFLQPQWRRAPGGRLEPSSPHRYRAMVQAAAPAVRRAAPRALVLVGGTAGTGRTTARRPSDPMAPLRFLRALACVDAQLRPLRTGACRGFRPVPGDGWAHHPYSGGLTPYQADPEPDNVRIGDLPRLADLLDRLHALGRLERRQGVWVTEFGWQTSPPDPTMPFSPADQARMLPEGEQVARADPRVRSFAQFLLRDLPARPGRTAGARWGDYQSGLLYAGGGVKPAFRSLRDSLVVRPGAAPGTVRLDVHVRDAREPARVRVYAGEALVVDGRTAADGFGAVTVAADPGAAFRLQVHRRGRWGPRGEALLGAR